MLRFPRQRAKPSVITLADRARDQRHWERAAGYYQVALRRNPQNPPIWVQYGHVLKEAGDLLNAERAYRIALGYDPRNADTYVQLGHVLKIQGKTDEAHAAYLKAVAIDPSLNGLPVEFGPFGWSEAHFSQLRDVLGVRADDLTTPLSEFSASGDHHANGGGSDTFPAKQSRSLLQFRQRRRRLSRITLADQARDAGKWSSAAQYYREALGRNPRNAPIWVQYGHVLKEGRSLSEAEHAYRKAIEIDPNDADPYLHLGHLLKIRGSQKEAEAAYLRAITIDPSLSGVSLEFSRLGWSEAQIAALKAMLHPEIYSLGGGSGGEVPAATAREVVRPGNQSEGSRDYAEWVRRYDTIDDDDRRAIAAAIENMTDRPLISVVMPVYNTPEKYLRAAINSVRQQLYPDWELCIADDASTAPHVRSVLEHYQASDPRIKISYLAENGHISAASNSALESATGSFIALLDHDDELPEHALYMVAAALDANPNIDLIYSDEDRIDADGFRCEPYFKSDWNPDLMLSQNMFCHLGVYRRSLIERIGGFRSAYDGSQDYDLVLRAQSATTRDRIHHIPHVLYHWRAIPGSVALDAGHAKPYALPRAEAAIADALTRLGVPAEVSGGLHPAFSRVRYSVCEPTPRVTIIMDCGAPTDLIGNCIEKLLDRTDYPNFEVLIVDNQSSESATRAYLDRPDADPCVRVLSHEGPPNFSSMKNFAALHANGSLLCFLSNDTEVFNRNWLSEMVAHALQPGVGAVGGLLCSPDGRIQHAGFVLGREPIAMHAHQGLHLGENGNYGYFGRAAVIQNLSAVSAACLVMSKAVFEFVKGFNDEETPAIYADVDLCLRIRAAGYRIVWTPHAELYRHTPTSPVHRAADDVNHFMERDYMLRRWGHVLDHDPCYNPNLSSDGRFDLGFPPRVEWAWRRGHSGRRAALTTLTEARLVAASGLFNPVWYLTQNPDVMAAGRDPLEHYLRSGSAEGRRPNLAFDPVWYREQYPDVAAAGIEPLAHYIKRGSAEGRRPSPHFDPVSYREQHPEVAVAGMEPLAHYLLTTSSADRGPHATGRLFNYPDFQIPDLFELRGMAPRGPIAVVVHLFYPELWDEIRIAVQRISLPFDIFVSLVKGASGHMRGPITQVFPHAYIFDFENRGRDLAAFLALLQTGALFRYELVCKLHSKRSPFESDGDGWRRTLIDGILGSSDQVNQIVSAFRSDPDLGIVVADGNIYSNYEHWSGNERLLSELLPRIGISPAVKGRSFPGGSMFWIKPFLLRTLAGAQVNLNDFEPEPLPRDGALGHSVERMFGLICEDAGMRVAEWSQLKKIKSRQARGSSKVHIFAYYLPQFHPIPENNMWWGAGFTEWTNVTRAKPLFSGHRQPRLPSELGFCDLRLAETREAQASLARQYGISGFCYYYYWFNGRRILERPLDEILTSGRPDFPFLICWANEPWSRNWDGLNDQVLLPQTYEPGWIKRLARDTAPLLRDRRYFHLDGRPMLLIYRIQHIPEAAQAMRELRAALSDAQIPTVHLAAAWVQFPNDQELPNDPAALGLDAYFEFPPHQIPAHLLQPRPADLKEDCLPSLYDYNRTVTAALERLDEPVKGRRHRCVMAAFDNTPRRGAEASVFHGATPTNFRRWMRGTVLHERQQLGERVVFVNAWNEWAEGTCLEPDRDFGRGWLEAVASAAALASSDAFPHPVNRGYEQTTTP